MDELIKSLAVSVAQGGPIYALILLIGIIFFLKVWPMIEEKSKRADDREDRAEQRMHDESVERRKHDEQMAKLQGQWLEEKAHSTKVQEQSNALMSSVDTKLELLTSLWQDSKRNSHDMGVKIDEIHMALTHRPESTD